MNIRNKLIIMLILALCISVAPKISNADFFDVSFSKIGVVPENNAENLSAQLNLRVWDRAGAVGNTDFTLTNSNMGAGDVLFEFTNNVGIKGSVSDIFMDDGTVLGIASVIVSQVLLSSGLGHTEFVEVANGQANFAGGQNLLPPFESTKAFAVMQLGNPNENGISTAFDHLGIIYDVEGGLTGVHSAFETGDLRIGLHVQAIGVLDGSDSYISGESGPIREDIISVPEPKLGLLLGISLIGLVGVGTVRMIKRNKVAKI